MAGSLVATDGSQEKKDEDEDEDEDAAGITRTPLITTTAQGGALKMKSGFPEEGTLVFLDMNEPTKLIDRFAPSEEPVVLAYQVQGRLPSLYPEGADLPEETPAPPPGLPPGIQLPPPPPGDETIHKDPVPEQERQPATVLVFADVDFISDLLAFQQTPFGAIAANDNHKVLLNAVDYLFGSEHLMKVRSKATIRRPFTLFDEIEAQADVDVLEREKQLRADVDRFQEELREKQMTTSARNAALFEKQVQDEVDELNRKIRESNAELREIRKQKRAALEGEETFVRVTTLGLTPALVLVLGLGLFFRRRLRDVEARRSNK
jgi:ABC-type uncharacterized transport system involved in gliding motility auxiliary subunit